MGAGARLRDLRPPLPAPTESLSGFDTDADAGTTVTARTDKSSYELPEDGSPVTIATHKLTGRKEGGGGGGGGGGGAGSSNTLSASHGRQKSQTSLLIEYFEASKTGDKTSSRPSVRVKVTPSSRKRSADATANDAVQITGIGNDRKPSYTRRISLGTGNTARAADVATDLSHSSGESNPPIEVQVLGHNASELSTASRGLVHAPVESNVSSMPPDSMLEGSSLGRARSRSIDRDEDTPVPGAEYLQAPAAPRDRSTSRDRITQKVMEKLANDGFKPRQLSKQRSEGAYGYNHDDGAYERAWRSAKERQFDDDQPGSGFENSVVSSDGGRSLRTGSDLSKPPKASNNPKLLQMVEDTIKRNILPEIEAIKAERRGKDSRKRDAGLERSISKSSSSPNISSKPKVVLNREGDEPGTVLSRGDSERQKRRVSGDRPSSRRSSGRGSGRVEEDAAAAAGAGLLTAAALKQHDSRDEVHRRRKKRSKSRSSRSKSTGLDEAGEEQRFEAKDIPPMPLSGHHHHHNDSELTRDSIMSANTERPHSPGSMDRHTPIQEVARGSLGNSRSPASSKSYLQRNVGTPRGSPQGVGGAQISGTRVAALAAAGLGGAAAAKATYDTYERHVDADGYGDPPIQRRVASPAQSVSSLKRNFEHQSLVPADLRPRSAASRSSAGRMHERELSQASLRSRESSPTTRLPHSRELSKDYDDEFITPQEHMNEAAALHDDTGTPGTPGTPSRGESVGDWYERQHRLNERYRDSLDQDGENARDVHETTNYRDSYQTNPYPQDEKRFTQFSDVSSVQSPNKLHAEQDVGLVGANPQFIHTPHGAESAVASLMDPSTLSSNRLSDQSAASPTKGSSYRDRMVSHLEEMNKDSPPAIYNGSTLSQTVPSRERWAAIRGFAHGMSTSSKDDISRGQMESPRQSPAKSLPEETTGNDDKAREPLMSASGIPVHDDPMPEIGHFDDAESVNSPHHSIIQGPLGGDPTGNSTWPFTPEPEKQTRSRDAGTAQGARTRNGFSRAEDVAAGALGAGALLAGVEALHGRKAAVEDVPEQDARSLTPDARLGAADTSRDVGPNISPATFPDEGYATDNHAFSNGGETPRAEAQQWSKEDLAAYRDAMDKHGDDVLDDPFQTDKGIQHKRNISDNSHGMMSPIYDAATGRGKDTIQSKDIVALMDHLTVRDAQRNAVDTEILVSLVRSAAEMRQSFDEMKRFIVEQDRLIMENADRGHEQTVQRVLGGPRPLPSASSPRTPQRQAEEDVQIKRKGVLRRALRGLTGGKSASDLARVEDMLMHILDNVEDLKHQQRQQQPGPPSGGPPTAPPSQTSSQIHLQSQSRAPLGSNGSRDTLDSYEKMRSAIDPRYEADSQTDSPSTQRYSAPPSAARSEKQQFHSGYDGRRGSQNRVSTVVEGDEEDSDLEPHEAAILEHQFENNERLLTTPTPATAGARGMVSNISRAAAYNIPPGTGNLTPRSMDKQNLHKSSSPSNFQTPKVSRWSKTTASSGAPDLPGPDSPGAARYRQPLSEASTSTRSLHRYEDGYYSEHSSQSAARGVDLGAKPSFNSSKASRHTRTPSPLIPSEASTNRQHMDEFDEEDERAVSPVQVDADFDDPKYQAHRNSLLLQHPQPRQGQTGRHQNTLESQAYTFDAPTASRTASDVSTRTVSDFDPATWGSSGTAGLAKHRLTQFEPVSPVSPNSVHAGRDRDDGPLVPQQQHKGRQQMQQHDQHDDQQQQQQQQKTSTPTKTTPRYVEPDHEFEPDHDWEPQYSNSGFSRGGHYSSPYGSGHLLEPIEEVRYSLETDSGHLSPEPSRDPPRSTGMRSAIRRITGPRPMTGTRGSSDQAPPSPAGAGMRRRPVASAAAQD